MCCKAQPKQVAGPVEQRSFTRSGFFCLSSPTEGTERIFEKIISTDGCFPLFPSWISNRAWWSGISNRPNISPKWLLLPWCLICLFGLHLVPCVSFPHLPSVARRTLTLFGKPWSNLTFSAMKAAFRSFCSWNRYSFSGVISFFCPLSWFIFLLDFIPPSTSIEPAIKWMTPMVPSNPRSLWRLQRQSPICQDHKPPPLLEIQTHISGKRSLLALHGSTSCTISCSSHNNWSFFLLSYHWHKNVLTGTETPDRDIPINDSIFMAQMFALAAFKPARSLPAVS